MLNIQSKSHPYQAIESPNVRAAIETLPGRASAFYLIDRKVAQLYEAEFNELIPADRRFLIEASEQAKSYESLGPIFCWLLEAKCRRTSHLIVIGGGVLQDIGCFIASVLMRGIRWTLIPTTLLAQCDSCIGSKSSLNINRFKNQLGTFYPPHEVRLVFDFLKTLTREEIHSGLGEAIKLHLIEGQKAADRLRKTLNATKDAELPLAEIVWDCLRIKKRFIEDDEFDQGIRNLLNYGHTFAHAFESATQYAIPHGIAVTMGVACATYFSEQLNMVPSGSFQELLSWIKPYFSDYLPTLKQVDLQAVVDGMKQDKKNLGDQVMFVLTGGPGMMSKVALDAQAVPGLLKSCLESL